METGRAGRSLEAADRAILTAHDDVLIKPNTPHSALVFGPVGVHNALNGLVDHVEDEGAG
jgi:hypothetical protein